MPARRSQQAMCLMRGMDATRNLGPPLQSLPPGLASRIGETTGLPSREVLSSYLSKQNLETDFAAHLWEPVSRAHDNDPDAPMARYFVIHDTSGPNYGHRAFPDNIDTDPQYENLADYACSDGWGTRPCLRQSHRRHACRSRLFDCHGARPSSSKPPNSAARCKACSCITSLIQPRERARPWLAQRRAIARSRLHRRAIRPAGPALHDRQRAPRPMAYSCIPCRDRCGNSQRSRRPAEFRYRQFCR